VGAEFGPRAAPARVLSISIDVMKQDNAAGSHLGLPRLQHKLDGVSAPTAMGYVQQINRAVSKMFEGFVDWTFNQAGETPVQAIVVGPQFGQGYLFVLPPVIDSVAGRPQLELFDSLAEGAKRAAIVRA
jgi:hypothetical protein